MINGITINNFQSLHSVSLTLAPLTVIVGPSSSGKSALTRAIKTLTSNQRGNAFISHGERVCTITATTDRGTVSLKRGKGTSDNEYILLPIDALPERFTKLGGETPPEVSAFIGISPRDPINYAGQFDKPYLLDESASEVARTLGQLTNVNVIFEAARESNRRKLSTTQDLRRTVAELNAVKDKLPTYTRLKAQTQAITAAEQHLLSIKNLDEKLEHITMLTLQIAAAEQTIKTTKRTSTQLDMQPLMEQHSRIEKLISTIRAILTAEQDRDSAAEQQLSSKLEETTAEQQYTDRLRAAGTCPTCKQSTKGLQHEHE